MLAWSSFPGGWPCRRSHLLGSRWRVLTKGRSRASDGQKALKRLGSCPRLDPGLCPRVAPFPCLLQWEERKRRGQRKAPSRLLQHPLPAKLCRPFSLGSAEKAGKALPEGSVQMPCALPGPRALWDHRRQVSWKGRARPQSGDPSCSRSSIKPGRHSPFPMEN